MNKNVRGTAAAEGRGEILYKMLVFSGQSWNHKNDLISHVHKMGIKNIIC